MSPPRSPVSKEKALAVLGLPPGAGYEDVRRAYRRLAFEYHPDRHEGRSEMEGRFKQVGEAYRALIEEGVEKEASAPGSPPRKGRDLHYDVQVDFMMAASGGEVGVRIKRPFPCPACDGFEPEGCSACGGEGSVLEEALVGVRLPSGLEDGETVRVAHEGAPGEFGGAPGDLVLTVKSARHPALERLGLDVHSEVAVPPFRLKRGGPVRVFTVKGGAQTEIPPGTPSGRTFRLQGWGVERTRGGRTFRGDHIVRIVGMPGESED